MGSRCWKASSHVPADVAAVNFQKFMREVVEGLGKDPDAVPKVEGEPVVDEGLTFKVLTTAPLKGRVRTEEKVSGWSGRERESGGEEVLF